MIRLAASLAVLAVLAVVPGAAKAGIIYQIEGVLAFGSSPNGTFSITVDEDDLSLVLDNSNPQLGDPLFISPWYGYDVLDANVTIGTETWGIGDLRPDLNEPASGGPTAALWIQGTPIGTAIGDFSIIFQNANNVFVNIGTHTTTRISGIESNIISSEVDVSGSSFNLSGRYEQVSVSEVIGVPEPGSLAIFGIGALGLLIARRRRKS